jgi:hypothetical protein
MQTPTKYALILVVVAALAVPSIPGSPVSSANASGTCPQRNNQTFHSCAIVGDFELGYDCVGTHVGVMSGKATISTFPAHVADVTVATLPTVSVVKQAGVTVGAPGVTTTLADTVCAKAGDVTGDLTDACTDTTGIFSAGVFSGIGTSSACGKIFADENSYLAPPATNTTCEQNYGNIWGQNVEWRSTSNASQCFVPVLYRSVLNGFRFSTPSEQDTVFYGACAADTVVHEAGSDLFAGFLPAEVNTNDPTGSVSNTEANLTTDATTVLPANANTVVGHLTTTDSPGGYTYDALACPTGGMFQHQSSQLGGKVCFYDASNALINCQTSYGYTTGDNVGEVPIGAAHASFRSALGTEGLAFWWRLDDFPIASNGAGGNTQI